jgi:hypothetical protein
MGLRTSMRTLRLQSGLTCSGASGLALAAAAVAVWVAAVALHSWTTASPLAARSPAPLERSSGAQQQLSWRGLWLTRWCGAMGVVEGTACLLEGTVCMAQWMGCTTETATSDAPTATASSTKERIKREIGKCTSLIRASAATMAAEAEAVAGVVVGAGVKHVQLAASPLPKPFPRSTRLVVVMTAEEEVATATTTTTAPSRRRVQERVRPAPSALLEAWRQGSAQLGSGGAGRGLGQARAMGPVPLGFSARKVQPSPTSTPAAAGPSGFAPKAREVKSPFPKGSTPLCLVE